MTLSQAFDIVHSFILEELETRESSYMPTPTESEVDSLEDAKRAELAVVMAREVSNDLLTTLKVLDKLGGLGLDKHDWLRKSIAGAVRKSIAGAEGG